MSPRRMSTRSCSRGSTLRCASAIAVVLSVTVPAVPGAEVRLPPAGAAYDSQLGGAYEPPAGVQVVSRDREEPPAPGLYNVCYVNAFQTQPQDAQWWLDNHSDLLLHADGAPLEDPNWPGEYLLDTRAGPALMAIVEPWITGCADAGFDAIEADNLDTYSRSLGLLGIEDNLAYAQLLIAAANEAGLSMAQKNGGDLGSRGREIGFDFAIVESCQLYDECGLYTDVFGDLVFEIEYTDTDPAAFTTACQLRGNQISVILRDRGLSMPGVESYFYQTC
jgi:hypothetical protein